MIRNLSLPRPDDWHIHFRDEGVLQHTVPASATHFARGLVMPNLNPPLTSIDMVLDYRSRINTIIDNTGNHFTPYMTLYLNEHVSPDDLIRAAKHPHILGAKLYPAGSTTNSKHGAHSVRALYPLLDIMQSHDLVLQIHGELATGDIFEREALFLESTLTPILKQFPNLRIVLEHISTRAAVEFVRNAPSTIAATITPHHLRYNRNHLLSAGIKPHLYCLPILKHKTDQLAVQEAASSGSAKFFAGTDSAPHARTQKENACGCAGIYSAPYALALYADTFDQLGKLTALPDFTSRFGAEFYKLPQNTTHIELIRQPQQIPAKLPFGKEYVIPMAAGSTIQWSSHDDT